ncbi:histidinol-phosphate transaminase [Roseivirga sp. UBA838]|uniref:pyridoxal phosphate-dependent aminotransferase n=1 Tax=Roseivirga sp. UBA838 TaxID=1947393 RepID=UPI002580AB0B|nr:histidinol-phosphate transaminase [Roseivirga sp. UBA838]|tara:strand:- start:52390 stop:53496 length:1107 start_codon:yes stop_codon:yes gene_type:complete
MTRIQQSINRRDWLGTALTMGGSLLLSPYLSKEFLRQNDAETVIKLNANENPYGPPKSVLDSIRHFDGELFRYQGIYANNLREQLASFHGLESQMIMLGAGSSVLLQLLGHYVQQKSATLHYCSPTFNILPDTLKKAGGKLNSLPLTTDYKFDLAALKEADETPGAIYLVNPNNPTGTFYERTEMELFCKSINSKTLIILDEAYIEYAGDGQSLVGLLKQMPNLIIVRTFSKIYGMAGLRMGYLMASAAIIRQLQQLVPWPNHDLSTLSLVAAGNALQSSSFVQTTRTTNARVMQSTIKALESLGYRCSPSVANFVYFNTKGKNLRAALEGYGVQIGQLDYENQTFARVTVGKEQEMERFVQCLQKLN